MVGPCRSPRSAVASLVAGLLCALLLPVALTGQDQSLLIDKEWTIWMIDHSGAFRTNATLRSPGNLSKVERRLLDRLRQLNQDTLRRAAGGYLNDEEITSLLKRRDRIVEHFDAGGLSLLFDRKARCC